jgi:hypothetical protein
MSEVNTEVNAVKTLKNKFMPTLSRVQIIKSLALMFPKECENNLPLSRKQIISWEREHVLMTIDRLKRTKTEKQSITETKTGEFGLKFVYPEWLLNCDAEGKNPFKIAPHTTLPPWAWVSFSRDMCVK